MSNPISNTPAFALPPISFPLLDPSTGQMALWWYRSLLALYERTGGPGGVLAADSQTIANQALTTAQAAATAAVVATNLATAADQVAANAQTAANAALSAATSATGGVSTINGTMLLKTNNLGDVASAAQSRSNLGVSVVPVSFSFVGVPPAGAVRYVPVILAMSTEVNLVGMASIVGTAATANTVFSVGYLRNGLLNTIGSITFAAATRTGRIATAIPATLQSGDVLVITAPATPDATAADIAITLRCTLL